MKKKEFKAESKRLLDLMINSIYTNKDIFLRELISNASDAMDKLYFNSLTDKRIKIDKEDFEINLYLDKKKREISICDNGIGMSKEELETNLGTIAESGSYNFKNTNKSDEIDIIGQFGVGFYSVFMVASKVEVISKKYGSDEAYVWTSSGIDGYTIEKCEKETYGTHIIITIKEDDDFEYSDYLDQNKIDELIKKYSNYVHYPIKMEMTHIHYKEDKEEEHTEIEVLNSMTPLWKKDKNEITEEEYNEFYKNNYSDYQDPIDVINYSAEGTSSFRALMYIPSHAPMDLYSKEYKKGLQLYSSGVLIMDKCEDLLPDYYSFVRGLVDSEDISLNISREMLQQDKQLKVIAKNVEKKINSSLKYMLENDREKYNKFFKEFGMQLKIGIYNSYGMAKDDLQDLLLFYSSRDDEPITLKEYVEVMPVKQDKIYYAVGESKEKISLLPQVEDVMEKSYEVLYLTDYADEFVLQMIKEYDGKEFINVANSDLSLGSDEEKEQIKEVNEENKDLLDKLSELLNKNVSKVKFTNTLKKHPVCLTTEGNISTGMEKIINSIPTEEKVTAQKVLSININHPIADKLKKLYSEDINEFESYAKILYAQARLIEGLTIDNPNEISDLICEIISK